MRPMTIKQRILDSYKKNDKENEKNTYYKPSGNVKSKMISRAIKRSYKNIK